MFNFADILPKFYRCFDLSFLYSSFAEPSKQKALKTMAKIKTSALVADIKGTVGGNVFAANKGGNYVRRYKKPTNANTAKQQAVRELFGTMAGLWRGLTDIQRTSWIEGAVNFPYQDTLGETRVYSGQQLFNKLNNNLIQIQQSTLETCPTPQSFPEVAIQGVNNVTAGNLLEITINFDGTNAVPANFFCIVNATTSVSAGVSSPQKALFKKIKVFEDGDGTGGVELSTQYNDNFGALITGDTVFISASIVNLISGEASVQTFIKSTRLAVEP